MQQGHKNNNVKEKWFLNRFLFLPLEIRSSFSQWTESADLHFFILHRTISSLFFPSHSWRTQSANCPVHCANFINKNVRVGWCVLFCFILFSESQLLHCKVREIHSIFIHVPSVSSVVQQDELKNFASSFYELPPTTRWRSSLEFLAPAWHGNVFSPTYNSTEDLLGGVTWRRSHDDDDDVDDELHSNKLLASFLPGHQNTKTIRPSICRYCFHLDERTVRTTCKANRDRFTSNSAGTSHW